MAEDGVCIGGLSSGLALILNGEDSKENSSKTHLVSSCDEFDRQSVERTLEYIFGLPNKSLSLLSRPIDIDLVRGIIKKMNFVSCIRVQVLWLETETVFVFLGMAEGCAPTVVTYSTLIRGYLNMEMVAEAWDVFHNMKHKGPLLDFKTYSMFLHCLCKAGRSEEAMQLISEMLNSGMVLSVVNF